MKMTPREFQARLVALGYDLGSSGPNRDGVDGWLGTKSKAAFMAMMTDGPDTPLDDCDMKAALKPLAARAQAITLAHVMAAYDVESTGQPFIAGRPTILPEPHRFSRNTQHRFDGKVPARVSNRRWDRSLYPATQAARYDVLWDMIRLDPWAGFASASYGGFQVLGENYSLCEFADPMAFARAHAQTVAAHLMAFTMFVINRGLADDLGRCRPNDPESCVDFCRGYNGTAFRVNRYHERFARALAAYWGRS